MSALTATTGKWQYYNSKC